MNFSEKTTLAAQWFTQLRDDICQRFETLEAESVQSRWPQGTFERKAWDRPGGGGGVMSIMRGRVFEKVGVNISTVHGPLPDALRNEMPGAKEYSHFWASGISLVAHLRSPLVPAVHMNTRMIALGQATWDEGSEKLWFGGGSDLNPAIENEADTAAFHAAFKAACDASDPAYYPKFSAWCDEYFFVKHRGRPRGVGGIFYDYLNTGNWAADFAFTQAVGRAFAQIYPQIVAGHLHEQWTDAQREQQLIHRGLYAEFNLVYDRGTKFGLLTGGNIEAILMSLPPVAMWP